MAGEDKIPNHPKIERVMPMLLQLEKVKKDYVDPKMERVMSMLLQLEKDEKDYLPEAASFGPYHHGEANLAFVEASKPTAVRLFTSDSPELEENKELELICYNEVLDIIGELRSCYVETSMANYTDAYLAQMLLRDAALLIILMEVYASDSTTKLLDKKHTFMTRCLGMLTTWVLFRDMVLLENQIPLRVIRVLVDARYGVEGRGDELVHRFLIMNLFGYQEKKPYRQESNDSQHILQLIHRLTIFGYTKEEEPAPSSNSDEESLQNFVADFRAATDLKAKGIYIKPSLTQSLKDVSFKYYFLYARLRIPKFTVNADTKVHFKNMIAYELSPSGPGGYEIVSFINFIKSLIEKAEDVKELREKKILLNKLGSDEEVVDMLKDINTHGGGDVDIYQDVRKEISAHCDNQMKTWIAELIHTNFESPWTMFAFLAAILLLVVTVAQLYYAIYPN